MESRQARGWRFQVDRGGTFTDVIALWPDGTTASLKLLSDNPGHYDNALVAGIRALMDLTDDEPLPSGQIEAVRIGTTVATNALLERTGARVLLVVNRGFGDLLVIRDQARPQLFSLAQHRHPPLYERVLEIDGRVDAQGREIVALDEDAVLEGLRAARAQGIEACAIALIHSWKYPEIEERIAALARAEGFTEVSASSAVSPLLRLVPRAETAVVDAYLSPVLRRYVDDVARRLGDTRILFMQSNGGLVEARRFRGKDAILSGPAGGVVGAARTAAVAGFDHVIGFDMGGTSTDVSLYAAAFERTLDSEIAGVRVRTPMMAINTVAAGGGSVLAFDGARFRVGPQSAGAFPGPACYGNGGPLTVTDANLLVGKIQPAHFPAVFGASGRDRLDPAIVTKMFDKLADDIEAATGARRDPRDIASGFLHIAVANVANAIKQISVQKGHDPSRFVLQCFGGAGGQHACQVADELGMETVIVHPFAGVLSAWGIGLADQTVIRERSVETPLLESEMAGLRNAAASLAREAIAALAESGVDGARISTTTALYLKYRNSEAALRIAFSTFAEVVDVFAVAHMKRFGFVFPERQIVVEAVSVEAIAAGEMVAEREFSDTTTEPVALEMVDVWSPGGAARAPVHDRERLAPGMTIAGPALIREANTTTFVETGWRANLNSHGHLLLTRVAPRAALRHASVEKPDPVMLELFNNLFMSIAEQSGAVLQNTSLSVNIRERLDFSCAIFNAEGDLVANAPHVPVHLGAMGESVKVVLRKRGASLRPGMAIALNNPYAGGTHLPDVTVVTPVFDEAGERILFFAASRGHHADIGGMTPGSTPARSQRLEDEGIVIDDFLLVDGSRLREAEFRDLLRSGRWPARSPDVNVADIKAQIAANERSVQELRKAVAEYGWPMVSAYMRHVMDNAEENIRRAIMRLRSGSFRYAMDDGAILQVRIDVDHVARTAVVDFTGTGAQRADNFNAPPAITRAAVLYVFRCLAADDIPLNDGCLKPVEIRIPGGTFLSPLPGAAVVAGNTEISQAVCNVLLGALGVAACSQATMNNFLFGDATRQYYETICGGTGAGPGFNGTSAVQAHMTNTRMTDPEILELRYPVRVEEFCIRRNSGGGGRWRGGDGAVRRIRFLEPMTAVIVSSQRDVSPFGLEGGQDGARGRQWIERANGLREDLPRRAQAELQPGDVVVIETPGGGGFGAPEDVRG